MKKGDHLAMGEYGCERFDVLACSTLTLNGNS